MSLASALTISLSGIQAASTQLELTASNISNSSSEGYTTKKATLAAATLGSVGGGVQVIGFTRSSNNALYTTLTKATSNASLRSAQDDYLQQVQDLLGTSASDDPALTTAVSDFINAWKELAASPESLVAQRQVVQDAVVLSDEVRRIAQEVEALDRQCYSDIGNTVTDLNSYLSQIKDLNVKIAQATNSNLSSGDLQDERDQLILKVSEMTGVTILQRDFGQVALYTSTGYQLVDGSSAREFTYDGTDITSTSNPGLSLNTALAGGKLEALVNFRATSTPASTDPGTNVIQKLRSQLDTIVDAFTNVVTTATSGTDTFANAYDVAPTGAGELAANFWGGATRTTFQVNVSLLDGTATVKVGAAQSIVDALLDSTRSFTADGLALSNTSYTSLVTSSLTTFQQAANNIATLQATAEDAKDYLKEKYTNETGVNVDNELVNLTTLQNSYAASAHAMSVVQELFATLERLL